MVGRATLTMVRSTMVMKYATTSREKARQRRTGRWGATPAVRSARSGERRGAGNGIRRRSSTGPDSVVGRAMVSLLSRGWVLRGLKHRPPAGFSDEFAA